MWVFRWWCGWGRGRGGRYCADERPEFTHRRRRYTGNETLQTYGTHSGSTKTYALACALFTQYTHTRGTQTHSQYTHARTQEELEASGGGARSVRVSQKRPKRTGPTMASAAKLHTHDDDAGGGGGDLTDGAGEKGAEHDTHGTTAQYQVFVCDVFSGEPRHRQWQRWKRARAPAETAERAAEPKPSVANLVFHLVGLAFFVMPMALVSTLHSN